MDSLGEKVYRGFNWNFLNQVTSKFISFSFGIFLARLLHPSDFGLIAMAAVFLGFAEIFKDFGISSAIIQRKSIRADELSTIFWLSIFTGGGIAILVLLMAQPLAIFYKEPIMVKIVAVLALNFFLSSFSLVHLALLIKSFDFKKLFYVSVLAEILSATIAIILALKGWGFWSIIAKMLFRTLFTLVFLWSWTKWIPQFRFSKKEVRHILHFSVPLVGTQSMNYWVRNIDDLLIGKIYGDQALGIYDRSYAFLTLPLGQIKGIVGKVAFPVFSAIQSDPLKVQRFFLKMTRLVGLISFPFMAGLYIVANDLVFFLLGEKWMGVVTILKIFALTGVLQSVVVLIGILFVSQGATKLQFKLGIFTSGIGVAAILIGLNWGVKGVAWGLFIATIVNLGPNVYFAGRLVGMSFLDWVANLKGVLLCTLIMFLGLWNVQSFTAEWSTFSRLVGLFIAGMMMYWLSLKFLNIKAYKELLLLIPKLLYGKA